jgi:hypothetical protein
MNVANRHSELGLGYQRTGQANLYQLPRTRYTADYTINTSPNTAVTVAYFHDKDYTVAGVNSPFTGNASNTGVVRFALQF